ALQELRRILEVALIVSQRTQPAELLRVLRIDTAAPAFLVLPVRGDAFFSHAVHLLGADLHLDALAARANHRRVERLVHVRLGQRDVVLEAPWDGRPARMDRAEAGVTVRL